ncbi:MAG: plasma-membrane proton-efflux P-type ATPase [Patescibacteria group bacterium]|nr:plasma-membrane proton-efflux P-type ATPase [Patescibacteria group bacterium]
MENFGLSQSQAEAKLKEYGLNEIPSEKKNFFEKIFKWLISPISLMLLTAALISLVIGKIFNFFFILGLMVLNFSISFWQENKADRAIEKLNKQLNNQVKVYRDQKWQWLDSRFLAPEDLIELTIGDIVPADAKIVEAKNLSLNEAAVTGESLPKDKTANDLIYAGSFVATGWARMVLTATGKNTYFGKTVFLIERSNRKSLLEQDIIRISKFLSYLSLIGVIIFSVFFIWQKFPLPDLIILDLSLIIAGIPISLPTVMTLVIEFGVIELAKKNALVRRISALEDFANVDLVLTDKTGTLTKNEISVQEIIPYSQKSLAEIISLALFGASQDDRSPINRAILNKAKELKLSFEADKLIDFVPADSDRKRNSVVIKAASQKILIDVGASQVIEGLVNLDQAAKVRLESDVIRLAQSGYRVLAVATKTGDNPVEAEMDLIGLIVLSDTLEPDANEVLDFMKNNGISVKIVTGDNRAIGQEVSRKLGLAGRIIDRTELSRLDYDQLKPNWLNDVAGFSEILPRDKFNLVKWARKYFIVASTGDGVNDLPALKEANVGIAVKNAVDALKSTADIVLLSSGVSVIKDAIIESRRIFARLYTYSTYRISESLRLIVTIVVLGLIYKTYPLTPIQIMVIALLNDLPIITLAFDRVKLTNKPSKINVKDRFQLSTIFGLAGVANSLILFFLMKHVWFLSWPLIKTVYFLKIVISGDMLIYIAHTKERWYKFLPSRQVILATIFIQLSGIALAMSGLMMPVAISLGWVVFVWLWSFMWMQITELTKFVQSKLANEQINQN